MQAFPEPIVGVEWHNRSHISFLLKTKLYIYKNNTVLHKFDIGYHPFETEFAIKNEILISQNQKIYDLHFNKFDEELVRVAYLSPNNKQPMDIDD